MILTVKILRERLRYDHRTGLFTHRWNRCSKLIGKRAGYLHRHTGYWILSVADSKIRANIAAWAMYYGRFPEGDIDHKDLNKLNNKIRNLREANKSKNGANRPKQKNNTSGYKGVFFMKQANRWLVQIGVRGKLVYIGCFADKEVAAAAYNAAAEKYHGEFARAK